MFANSRICDCRLKAGLQLTSQMVIRALLGMQHAHARGDRRWLLSRSTANATACSPHKDIAGGVWQSCENDVPCI